MLRSICLSLAACTLLTAGCQSLGDAGSKLYSELRAGGSDYRDPADDDADEWAFVGTEGRAGQEREVDPDPWWKNKVMSAKARSIERNLGFD